MRLRLIQLVLLAALSAMTLVTRADEASDAALLERLMGANATAFARLDLAHVTAEQLSIPLALGALAKYGGRPSPEDLVASARALHQAGPRYAYIVIQSPAGMKYLPEIFYVVPTGSQQPAEKVEPALQALAKATLGDVVQIKRLSSAILAGGAATMKGFAESTSGETGRDVAATLALAGEAPLMVALAPSHDQRRVLQELLPLLPAEPLRKEFAGSVAGFRWGVVALSPAPELAFRMVVQYGDEAQANSAAPAMAALGLAFGKAFHAEQGLASVKPQAVGNRVVVELDPDGYRKSTAFLQPFLTAATTAAERATISNRLKHVGIAFHNLADVLQRQEQDSRFGDSAIRDKQGRPLLSWRVMLLPYLDANDLYREFHLDEPWDSEHNRQLIPRMPEVYRLGTAAKIAAGKTCLLLPIGEETIFPAGHGAKFKDIRDGISNTILAVEATDDQAVIWTRPDDLSVDPEQAAMHLGGHFGPGFLALMADGSVQYFEKRLGEEKIWSLFTRDGGEPNVR